MGTVDAVELMTQVPVGGVEQAEHGDRESSGGTAGRPWMLAPDPTVRQATHWRIGICNFHNDSPETP